MDEFLSAFKPNGKQQIQRDEPAGGSGYLQVASNNRRDNTEHEEEQRRVGQVGDQNLEIHAANIGQRWV